MKKYISLILMLTLLTTGCSSESDSSASASAAGDTNSIYISMIEFSASDARSVLRKAVDDHCSLLSRSCTVQTTTVTGNDITGTYTFTEDDDTYTGGVILKDVKVLTTDSSIVTIGEKYFETPVGTKQVQASDNAEESEENTAETVQQNDKEEETETDTDISSLNLPVDEPDSDEASGTLVKEDTGVKVYTFRIASDHLTFEGSFEGEGTLTIYVYPYDQKTSQELITQKGSGEFSNTITVEPGWYYVVIQSTDGYYSASWNY